MCILWYVMYIRWALSVRRIWAGCCRWWGDDDGVFFIRIWIFFCLRCIYSKNEMKKLKKLNKRNTNKDDMMWCLGAEIILHTILKLWGTLNVMEKKLWSKLMLLWKIIFPREGKIIWNYDTYGVLYTQYIPFTMYEHLYGKWKKRRKHQKNQRVSVDY